MPSDFTAGLDIETAHAEMMVGDCNFFFRQVDLAEQFFSHILVRSGAGLLAIGGDFVYWAFTCAGGSDAEQ